MKGASLSKIIEMLKVIADDVKELCGKNDIMKSFPNFNKLELLKIVTFSYPLSPLTHIFQSESSAIVSITMLCIDFCSEWKTS